MSDFWVRKMKTYFQRIDFDKDGSITRMDFTAMADRFIATGKLQGDEKAKLKDSLTQVWDKYLSVVGGGEKIDMEPFISSMKKLVKDESMKATLEGPLPLFFQSVDSNNDGIISKEEFGNFFEILGIDKGLSTASFEAIDDNHDGQISLDEFITSGSEFFLTEDETKASKVFWGPLV